MCAHALGIVLQFRAHQTRIEPAQTLTRIKDHARRRVAQHSMSQERNVLRFTAFRHELHGLTPHQLVAVAHRQFQSPCERIAARARKPR